MITKRRLFIELTIAERPGEMNRLCTKTQTGSNYHGIVDKAQI
ncbi:MAG: hypothetical protein ACYC2R_15725 [Burkholderiales bacterium]